MSITTSAVFTIVPAGRRFRLLSLGYGLLMFIWMGPEENVVWPVVLMGMGLAVLSVTWGIQRWLVGTSIVGYYVPPCAALTGSIIGVSAMLTTAGLMFFKNALHAHVFWDYPPDMIAAMLTRALSWGLAGGLAGLGIGCLWVWRNTFASA